MPGLQDNGWWSERGGSDVSGTEILTTYAPVLPNTVFRSTGIDGSPLEPWLIDGFKWFLSATDSQMTILLAQTPNGPSAFYASMHRTIPSGGSELNCVTIQRLKNKIRTKALPTAELGLKGTRVHLIGEEGHGVRVINTMLNSVTSITNISTTI